MDTHGAWGLTSNRAARVQPDRFRDVLGHFCSGLTIVTSVDADGPVGVVCQSFASLSLEPPLVAVCAGKQSTSWPRIRRSKRYCANVLTEHQQPLCATFAATGADKFADVSWTLSTQGLPVLDQVLAWIDCEVEDEVDSGDHTILIGRVVDLAVGPGPASPLLFFRGQFGRFSEAPSDIPQH